MHNATPLARESEPATQARTRRARGTQPCLLEAGTRRRPVGVSVTVCVCPLGLRWHDSPLAAKTRTQQRLSRLRTCECGTGTCQWLGPVTRQPEGPARRTHRRAPLAAGMQGPGLPCRHAATSEPGLGLGLGLMTRVGAALPGRSSRHASLSRRRPARVPAGPGPGLSTDFLLARAA